MTTEWSAQDTTTHQDHVIAHLLGATVLGYLILDEILYVLLDIGFIWQIYTDGEMGLLPHPVTIGELEADEEIRVQIRADIDLLLSDEADGQDLKFMTPSPVICLIKDVTFFTNGERRRLVLAGEETSLAIETSLDTGEIRVSPLSE